MFRKIISKLFTQSHSVSQEIQTALPVNTSEALEKECAAYMQRGDALQRTKQYVKSVAAYQRAIEYDPCCVDAYIQCGDVFYLLKNTKKAAEMYQMAIAIDPNNAAAYFALAKTCQQEGKMIPALSCYEKVLQLNPNHVEALSNVAAIFVPQYDQHVEAEKLLLRALALKPDLVEAYINLGVLYLRLGRFLESEQKLKQAITFDTHAIEAYMNLGLTLYCQNKISEATSYFKKALSLDPQSHIVKWNYSQALLKNGDYELGWKYYENRLKTDTYIDSFLGERYRHDKKWQQGENIAGKKIVVHAEQGLGDTLQFVRFIPLLAARGATVILDCQAELTSLLASVPGVSQAINYKDALPPHDLYISMMSLPALCNITLQTIPADIPYVTPNKNLVEYWKKTLGQHNQFRVGLVWAGNPRRGHKDSWGYYIDQRRRMSLEELKPLSFLDNIQWFSLQKSMSSEKIKIDDAHFPFLDYTDQFHTFEDTAAFITQLDLIITVDTSVAHLAGAMGKPVWVFSRFDGCWRWLLNRSDSPWYPTLRLFRQKVPGDWNVVVSEVKMALEEIVSAKNTVL